KLVSVDVLSGKVLAALDIGGVPDVIFFNPALKHLYVAIGDPGLLEVIDTEAMKLLETVPTETGAHTIAFDAPRNKVYAVLREMSEGDGRATSCEPRYGYGHSEEQLGAQSPAARGTEYDHVAGEASDRAETRLPHRQVRETRGTPNEVDLARIKRRLAALV